MYKVATRQFDGFEVRRWTCEGNSMQNLPRQKYTPNPDRKPVFFVTTNEVEQHYPQSTIFWIERLDDIPRMFFGRFFCCGAIDLPKYLGSIHRGENKFKMINVN